MKNIIKLNSKIFEALKCMNTTGCKTLFVIDSKRKYLGTITDGDIRRHFVNNKNLNINISRIYQKKSIFVYENKLDKTDLRSLFLDNHLERIPIINIHKFIVGEVKLRDLLKNNKKLSFIPLVIMAGGKGTRMKPLTNFIPKPLIPVKGKPMIENIFDFFSSSGLDKFYISLNIKDFLLKKSVLDFKNYNIKLIEEKNYLGTIGSVNNSKLTKYENFFVINCDILLDIDCQHILNDHLLSKKILTVVLVKKINISPYGLCKINNKNLVEITEKPESVEYINSGFYVLNKSIFKFIKKNKYLDMDQLIKNLIANKIKINTYSIPFEKWKDIGKFKNYIEYISAN